MDQFIGFSVPGLGIIITLLVLYLLGIVASNLIGQRIFNWIERFTNRIPLIKTTYQIGKQLSTTLSLPERQVFKRVVLVELLRPGSWTVGFVTGDLIDQKTNQKLLKVYVPTPPNPTSGFILILKTLKLVVSGGIIGPSVIE